MWVGHVYWTRMASSILWVAEASVPRGCLWRELREAHGRSYLNVGQIAVLSAYDSCIPSQRMLHVCPGWKKSFLMLSRIISKWSPVKVCLEQVYCHSSHGPSWVPSPGSPIAKAGGGPARQILGGLWLLPGRLADGFLIGLGVC